MKSLSKRIEKIEQYLDYLIENPKCELNFSTDYELLIAIVLSAQTTDKRVNQVTDILFSKYPDLDSLMNAKIVDLELILRPIGSFRKKALYVKEIATLLVKKFNSVVPKNRKILESFPGVGRKTINVFLCEFCDYPAIAVDTHVERVSKRLLLAKSTDNVLDVENKLKRKFMRKNWCKRHKQMVLFGRYYCKAINPMCDSCGLCGICKYYQKKIKQENA